VLSDVLQERRAQSLLLDSPSMEGDGVDHDRDRAPTCRGLQRVASQRSWVSSTSPPPPSARDTPESERSDGVPTSGRHPVAGLPPVPQLTDDDGEDHQSGGGDNDSDGNNGYGDIVINNGLLAQPAPKPPYQAHRVISEDEQDVHEDIPRVSSIQVTSKKSKRPVPAEDVNDNGDIGEDAAGPASRKKAKTFKEPVAVLRTRRQSSRKQAQRP
jgi:hypothetical protein